MKKSKLFICVLAGLFMLLVNTATAQDLSNTLPDDEDPKNVPIDGGLSLLLAAGVAYGAKKAHESRKVKKGL